MKILLFTIIFLTATVFTNQIVTPMSTFGFSKPSLHYSFVEKTTQHNEVCFKYIIHNPNLKNSTLTPLTPSNLTFVELTFTPTSINCLLKNTTLCAEDSPQNKYTMLLSISGGEDLYLAQEFNDPEIIDYFIKITLSAYFRIQFIIDENCIICSREISSQETAMLLNCGSAAHEKCYLEWNKAATARANGSHPDTSCRDASCRDTTYVIFKQNLSDDLWFKLEALPENQV